MGGMYYVASAGLYTSYYVTYGGIQLFRRHEHARIPRYGVIIGYMAGALNNGSTNFKRMLGAGLTSLLITAIIQAYLNYHLCTCTITRYEPYYVGRHRYLGVAGVYGFVLASFRALL